MKHFSIILFVFLFLFNNYIIGQTTAIKGNVYDFQTNDKIYGATISMLRQVDSTIIATTRSDKDGNFKMIANESFILYCSHINYENQYKSLDSTNFVTFKLKPIGSQLNEVLIETRKKLITFEGNRVTYNAENDKGAIGSNALDILKRVPLITVNLEGNILIKGEQSNNILINGKPMSAGRNIKDVLSSMNGAFIKKIEVMTNPPAKFDADGGGGVVNIITNKALFLGGTSNSLELTLGTIQQRVNNVFSYNKNKLAVGLSFSGSNSTNETESFKNIKILNSNIINQNSKGEINTKTFNSSFNLGYSIDSISKLEYNFDYNLYNFDYSYNLLQSNNINGESFNSKGLVLIDVPSSTLQTSISYLLRPKGKINEINSYVVFTKDRIPGNFSFLNKTQDVTSRNSTVGNNSDFTFGSDIKTVFGSESKNTLEYGAKGIFRSFGSTSYNNLISMNNPNAMNSDYFLNQNIISSYGEAGIKKGIKWFFRLGLRGEYFWQSNNSSLLNLETANDQYFILFPNIETTYNFSPEKLVSLSYSKRILRPSIFYLNPNNNQTDPSISYQGNGILEPEIYHNFELTYSTYWGNNYFRINPYIRYSKNLIRSIISSNENSVNSKYENIDKSYFYGVNLWSSIELSNNWKVYLNVDTGLRYFNDTLLFNRIKGYEMRSSLNNTVDLKGDWNIQGFIGLNFPIVLPQGNTNTNYYSSFSISKKVFNKKLTPVLRVFNPFQNRLLLNNKIETPNLEFDHGVYFYNRSIEISLKYTFGSSKKDYSNDKKYDSEDLKKSPSKIQDNNIREGNTFE
jgi:outer membrane receptor protein involved in Fe transport